MTKSLRSQLINHLKSIDSWENSARTTRLEFKHLKKGTLYKPETIGRELRRLYEEMPERIERREEGRLGSVAYRYKPSKYELIDKQMRNE